MEAKYVFETEMEVRDYECDIQGIVNNANYLHYTEDHYGAIATIVAQQNIYLTTGTILRAESGKPLLKIIAANAQMLFHYWKVGNYILYHQQQHGWGSKISTPLLLQG